jgi:hypothetical protein
MAYIRKVANKIGSPHKSADVIVDESVLLAKTLQGSTIMSFESIEDLRQISLETTFFKVRHQVPLLSSCHNGIKMQSHESHDDLHVRTVTTTSGLYQELLRQGIFQTTGIEAAEQFYPRFLVEINHRTILPIS